MEHRRDEQLEPGSYAWWCQLATQVRGATLTEYNVPSCVETVRVGIEVGRYFGYTITPQPVTLMIATREWDEFVAEHGYVPEARQYGWSLGTHGGNIDSGGNAWGGHLAGLAPGGVYLDLSADQFDRPAKGLRVTGPMCAAGIDLEQLARGIVLESPDGTVIYRATATDDQAWRRFPAWTKRASVIRRCAGQAIRALTR